MSREFTHSIRAALIPLGKILPGPNSLLRSHCFSTSAMGIEIPLQKARETNEDLQKKRDTVGRGTHYMLRSVLITARAMWYRGE